MHEKLRSVFMKYFKMCLFKIYDIWPQADIHTYIHTYIHTHNFSKCSHTSVGLAQARPNQYIGLDTQVHPGTKLNQERYLGRGFELLTLG